MNDWWSRNALSVFKEARKTLKIPLTALWLVLFFLLSLYFLCLFFVYAYWDTPVTQNERQETWQQAWILGLFFALLDLVLIITYTILRLLTPFWNYLGLRNFIVNATLSGVALVWGKSCHAQLSG